MSLMFKKLTAVLVLLSLAGCAGHRIIPVSELTDPPKSDSYFVTTQSGEQHEFVTLRVEGDNLLGTVRIVKQRVVGQGSTERIEERNQYREVSLPMSDIRQVEIRKKGPSGLVLAAAGAAAIGGAYLILNKSDEATAGTGGGGGKGPPGAVVRIH